MQTQHLNVGTASTRSILLHRKHTSVWHTSHRTVPRVSHGAACCALHPQGKCWGRLVFANWFSVAAVVLAVAAMTACTVVAAAACLQGSATSTCGQVGRADLGLKDVPAVWTGPSGTEIRANGNQGDESQNMRAKGGLATCHFSGQLVILKRGSGQEDLSKTIVFLVGELQPSLESIFHMHFLSIF